jgi:hypothetical protein
MKTKIHEKIIKSRSIKLKDSRAYCKKCEAEIIFIGVCLTLNPPLYIHKCEKCGKLANLNKIYPQLGVCLDD